MPLPTAALTRTYLIRGVLLWVAARVMIALLVALSPEFIPSADPVELANPVLAPVVLIGIALLGLGDVIRRRERAMLANLGVSDGMTMLIFGSAALIGEIALYLALRATQ